MNNPIIKEVAIRNIKCGEGVVIIGPSNLYDCELGDKAFVGPFVEIQNNVKIGSNTRIQSHSFICEKVTIGRNCFIGHGVKFVNDKFSNGSRANGDKDKYLETRIGDHVLIGSNATILPVFICSGTVIGAGAVVTKNIDVKGVYAGNPAKLLYLFKGD